MVNIYRVEPTLRYTHPYIKPVADLNVLKIYRFVHAAFITGLLHNIGTHVDPIKLIKVSHNNNFRFKYVK